MFSGRMDDYLSKPIITGYLMEILAYRLGTPYTETASALLCENIAPTENSRIVWDKSSAH